MNVKASIEIMRPLNGLMGCVTIVVGILNTWLNDAPSALTLHIVLACLMYFLIVSSAMIINDIYDFRIDRINRPGRPIPSGALRLKEAKALYGVTLGLAMVIAVIHTLLLNLGFVNVLLALLFGSVGWLYAAYGKKSGFPGNVIVSFSFSFGLIYGALLSGFNIPYFIYFFFLTTFFLLMAREIIKGCEDIRGDRVENVRTLAIILGKRKAALISAGLSMLAILFFVLPVFTPIINPRAFFVLMIPGVGTVLYALILTLSSGLNQKEISKISLLLKLGAFIGLLAFLGASI